MDLRLDADFDRAASTRPWGILEEFWYFLRTNKKWWLAPILDIQPALFDGLTLLSRMPSRCSSTLYSEVAARRSSNHDRCLSMPGERSQGSGRQRLSC